MAYNAWGTKVCRDTAADLDRYFAKRGYMPVDPAMKMAPEEILTFEGSMRYGVERRSMTLRHYMKKHLYEALLRYGSMPQETRATYSLHEFLSDMFRPGWRQFEEPKERPHQSREG